MQKNKIIYIYIYITQTNLHFPQIKQVNIFFQQQFIQLKYKNKHYFNDLKHSKGTTIKKAYNVHYCKIIYIYCMYKNVLGSIREKQNKQKAMTERTLCSSSHIYCVFQKCFWFWRTKQNKTKQNKTKQQHKTKKQNKTRNKTKHWLKNIQKGHN